MKRVGAASIGSPPPLGINARAALFVLGAQPRTAVFLIEPTDSPIPAGPSPWTSGRSLTTTLIGAARLHVAEEAARRRLVSFILIFNF